MGRYAAGILFFSVLAGGIVLRLLRDRTTLKQRLVSRWFQLSIVWSLFWLGSGTLDVFLRSGCHFGKCIFDMEEIRPIVVLAPTLAAAPWVVTGIALGVLWVWRRLRAR